MKVLIAGGGTGGHLFPGIALAQELRQRDPSGQVLFVGSPRGIEARAVPKAGFDLTLLPISGLRRMGVKELLLGLARLPVALWQAAGVVRRFRPDVAVSVGGYAAGPAVLMARIWGVPCVVMEQNTVPGFTNKVLGRLAKRVITALPSRGFQAEKTVVLGNPVRQDLLAVREMPYAPETPLRVLLFGGSQGARALNRAMIEAAPALGALSSPPRIVHQSGPYDADAVRDAYAAAGLQDAQVVAFIDDMAAAYADADLIICRAGATSLAELTVCGRPALLVPFPAAVDDHQTVNAKTAQEAGAARMLPQSELSSERLVGCIEELAHDHERLRRMARASHELGRPHAARSIADALEETLEHV